MRNKRLVLILFVFTYLFTSTFGLSQRRSRELSDEQKLLQVVHSIHSQTLYGYVDELASDKYWGRLTGTF